MNLDHLLGEPFLPADFPLPRDAPFTYRTARGEAGLSSENLHWLVAHGFLWRPVKGVYVDTLVPDSIELRCACLRLIVPEDAVVVDRHAGWLHGAEMTLEPNEHLNLAQIRVFLPAGRGRLRNGLADSGERTFLPADLMELGGLRLTTPIRTAWDLGRNRWPERSLAAMDQLLRTDLFTKEELVAGVERFKGARWVTTLRGMAHLADGRAESPPESILRLRWIEAHLPTPVPQLEVRQDGELLARLDLGNEELLYGAEYDGAEWHSTEEQQAHDRRRRKACEEQAGYLVDAFTKSNLWGATANVEQVLRASIAEARRRVGGRR